MSSVYVILTNIFDINGVFAILLNPISKPMNVVLD